LILLQYAKIRFFLGKTNIFHKNNTQKKINVVFPYFISPGPTENSLMTLMTVTGNDRNLWDLKMIMTLNDFDPS